MASSPSPLVDGSTWISSIIRARVTQAILTALLAFLTKVIRPLLLQTVARIDEYLDYPDSDPNLILASKAISPSPSTRSGTDVDGSSASYSLQATAHTSSAHSHRVLDFEPTEVDPLALSTPLPPSPATSSEAFFGETRVASSGLLEACASRDVSYQSISEAASSVDISRNSANSSTWSDRGTAVDLENVSYSKNEWVNSSGPIVATIGDSTVSDELSAIDEATTATDEEVKDVLPYVDLGSTMACSSNRDKPESLAASQGILQRLGEVTQNKKQDLKIADNNTECEPTSSNMDTKLQPGTSSGRAVLSSTPSTFMSSASLKELSETAPLSSAHNSLASPKTPLLEKLFDLPPSDMDKILGTAFEFKPSPSQPSSLASLPATASCASSSTLSPALPFSTFASKHPLESDPSPSAAAVPKITSLDLHSKLSLSDLAPPPVLSGTSSKESLPPAADTTAPRPLRRPGPVGYDIRRLVIATVQSNEKKPFTGLRPREKDALAKTEDLKIRGAASRSSVSSTNVDQQTPVKDIKIRGAASRNKPPIDDTPIRGAASRKRKAEGDHGSPASKRKTRKGLAPPASRTNPKRLPDSPSPATTEIIRRTSPEGRKPTKFTASWHVINAH